MIGNLPVLWNFYKFHHDKVNKICNNDWLVVTCRNKIIKIHKNSGLYHYTAKIPFYSFIIIMEYFRVSGVTRCDKYFTMITCPSFFDESIYTQMYAQL